MILSNHKILRLLLFLIIGISANTVYSSISEVSPIPLKEVYDGTLQGKWKRVSLDFRELNGQIIEVSGNKGMLSDAVSSPFSTGDIMWKDINVEGSGDYSLLVQGTDRQYYQAKIQLSGDALRLIIGPEGAGNIQKWERISTNVKSLDGSWTRVAGNNSRANGMTVKISGNSGIIENPAQTRLKAGDMKWKDILKGVEGNYTHQELGSDYNYYQGQMRYVQDDTLRVNVVFMGEGNVQTWVKTGGGSHGNQAGPGINPGATVLNLPQPNEPISIPKDIPTPITSHAELFKKPEVLPCEIDKPIRLVNGPGDVDYAVETGCVIDITAALTIEPGTVIEFRENSGLGIYDNGSLNAKGGQKNRIIFKGAQDIVGYWRGIHIETKSNNNILTNLTIANAGSKYVYCCNEAASLFLKGAKIALANVVIEKGGNLGIVSDAETLIGGFYNLRIKTHKSFPIQIHPNRVKTIATSCDFSGNSEDYIHVVGRQLDQSSSWRAQSIPYLIEDVLDVTRPLDLGPGTEIKFGKDGGLGIYHKGAITARGKSEAPIRFEGLKNGYWRGIHVETPNTLNLLEHVYIANAGSDFVYCCNEKASVLIRDPGVLNLSNVHITEGKGIGVYVGSGANITINEVFGVSIANHSGIPVVINAEALGALDSNSIYFGTGNVKPYIKLFGNINKETNWPHLGLPYRFDTKVMDITAPLHIEPGVVFEMPENSGLGIYDQGSLNAQGISDHPIVFKGVQDVQGYWRGIYIETNNSANRISHARIENAGSNYVYCCDEKAALLLKLNARLILEYSIIDGSGGCGIYVAGQNVNLTQRDIIFSANASGDICN